MRWSLVIYASIIHPSLSITACICVLSLSFSQETRCRFKLFDEKHMTATVHFFFYIRVRCDVYTRMSMYIFVYLYIYNIYIYIYLSIYIYISIYISIHPYTHPCFGFGNCIYCICVDRLYDVNIIFSSLLTHDTLQGRKRNFLGPPNIGVRLGATCLGIRPTKNSDGHV